MKLVLRSADMTVARLMGANALLAGSENFIDQFYKAKFGRLSPITEARLRAEQANAAYREEATPKAKILNTWLEDFGERSTDVLRQSRKRA